MGSRSRQQPGRGLHHRAALLGGPLLLHKCKIIKGSQLLLPRAAKLSDFKGCSEMLLVVEHGECFPLR